MAKKDETAEKPVEETKPVETSTEEVKDFNGEEVVETTATIQEGDTAVDASKPVSSYDTKPSIPMDDSKESKEVIKEDEKVKESVNAGEVVGLTAAQMSVVNKPLVPDSVTGRPVYETAEQASLAQAAAGKLATPDPEED